MNGKDGLFLFPVSKSISFVIRDNSMWRHLPRGAVSERNYDVFAITGNMPTIELHSECIGLGEWDTYDLACESIEKMMHRAQAIARLMRTAK